MEPTTGNIHCAPKIISVPPRSPIPAVPPLRTGLAPPSPPSLRAPAHLPVSRPARLPRSLHRCYGQRRTPPAALAVAPGRETCEAIALVPEERALQTAASVPGQGGSSSRRDSCPDSWNTGRELGGKRWILGFLDGERPRASSVARAW